MSVIESARSELRLGVTISISSPANGEVAILLDRAPRKRGRERARERMNEEALVSLTRRQYNAVSDVFRHSTHNSIASFSA